MKAALVFLFLVFASVPFVSISQTTLTAGDICVIAFKTSTDDEAGNDCVKLVTLVDLDCNTSFIVTDNNWDGSAWACDDDEFGVQITCNVAIASGSVFYLDAGSSGGTLTCSGGSVTRTNLGNPWGTNYGFNDSGDNLYVLQGSRAAPVFIYAWKHVGAFASSGCSDKDRAALPTGLSLGTSAVVMTSAQDQWHYNCVTNNGTKAAISSAVSNNSNWVSTTGQSWNNSTCIFTVTTGSVQYGVLAVSGAGCGCLAGCQLAYSGGVNCVTVAGNCTAGEVNMSKSIDVPVGCTYLVTAEMKNRQTCGSSGGDGSGGGCPSSTCDRLKVDILSGAKAFQAGAGNAALSDNYTLVGPGTIVVSGNADRADEIITYSIQVTPCACLTVLPIELVAFNAVKAENTVELSWTTLSEKNNSYFTIERSVDAFLWEAINIVGGQGTSSAQHNYTIYDSSPLSGISYYRLKQTDATGSFSFSAVVAVHFVNDRDRKVIKRINVYGQEIDENATGFMIIVYDNGDIKKIFKTQ